MLTEDEARTKWCPFIHTRITVVLPAGDRHVEQRAEHLLRIDRCIASTCMAWRSEERAGEVVERIPVEPESNRPKDFHGTEYRDVSDYSKGKDWVRYEMHEVGYCGLAGHPEVGQ